MDLFTKTCVIINFKGTNETIEKALQNNRFPDCNHLDPKKIRRTSLQEREIYTYDE